MKIHAPDRSQAWAVVFSLALHALVFVLAGGYRFRDHSSLKNNTRETIVVLHVLPAPPDIVLAHTAQRPAKTDVQPAQTSDNAQIAPTLQVAQTPALIAAPPRPVASMAAPPAPSAEEWAFAAKYPLKNSKGYRHSWGQQVRSLMGTADEGPDQGVVRFRVEIAPDGTLAKLDTL